jgi:hypothetical protein
MPYTFFHRGLAALILSVGSAAIVAGCANDPKAATKENFSHIISTSYDKAKGTDIRSLCLGKYQFSFEEMPKPSSETIILRDPKDANAVSFLSGTYVPITTDPSYISKMEALSSVGILVKKPKTLTGTRGFGHYDLESSRRGILKWVNPPKFPIAAFSYTPTVASYCYATFGFDHVDNFTVPGDSTGIKVSEVTYYKRIDEVKSWAQNEKVRAAFPEIDQALEGVKSEPVRVSMELTSNGWQVAQ